MAYRTSNVLTEQKLRAGAGSPKVYVSDPNNPFSVQDMLAIQRDIGSGVMRVVPMEYAAVGNETIADETDARAYLKANAAGIASRGTKSGEEKPIVCYWKGQVELECDAATWETAEFAMPAYDATNTRLMSNKWEPTANLNQALGRVVRREPINAQFGAATSTRVTIEIDIETFLNAP